PHWGSLALFKGRCAVAAVLAGELLDSFQLLAFILLRLVRITPGATLRGAGGLVRRSLGRRGLTRAAHGTGDGLSAEAPPDPEAPGTTLQRRDRFSQRHLLHVGTCRNRADRSSR